LPILSPRGRFAAFVFALVLAACADPPAAPAPTAHAQTREPVTAAGSFLAARHAERGRDWDGASRYLEQALAADPTNFDLLQRAHAAVVADGRFEDAVVLARRIVAVSSANPQANLTLAIEEIRAHFGAAGMSLRKTPEKLMVVDDFPRNAAGKIRKNELRSEAARLAQAESGQS